MASETELTPEDQRYLLSLARKTLEHLGKPAGAKPIEEEVVTLPIPEALLAPSGVFVSLHKGESLRGCIGYVEPIMPLYQAVIENTINAARRDPRFDPVTPDEVPELNIEISVMTPPREIKSVEEIEIGRHGLIVSKGNARGLLLPQVATDFQFDRETFLSQTCWKAGLPKNIWREGNIKIEVFTAQIFTDENEKRKRTR